MASPTANSVAITQVNLSGLPNTAASLIDGAKWGGGYGTSVNLTYSFPGETGESAYSASGYGYYTPNEFATWYALNASEREAVTQALSVVSGSINVGFSKVSDNSSTVGELRFGQTAYSSSYAHAYTPAQGVVESGDVWFSTEWNDANGSIARGSFDFLTILHEIGHALGLKHPFEPGNSGQTLPADFNTYTHTIMSYSPVMGELTDTVTASLNPTTFMFSDLLALETLYGPPTNANNGNTTYIFYDNQTYWQTIVDSGGNDTVKFISSADGSYIDLSNDTFSQIGKPVSFSNGAFNYDTIAFGPSTLIENAVGGGGNDTLIGNAQANKLTGNDGDDVLKGNAGNDNLSGGAGADKIDGGAGNDKIVWGAGDAVKGGSGTDTLKLTTENLNLLDLTKKVLTVEQIDMRGGTNGLLTLSKADVLELSSVTDNIRIFGDSGDAVDIAGRFSSTADPGGFRTYKLGSGAFLTIETDVLVG